MHYVFVDFYPENPPLLSSCRAISKVKGFLSGCFHSYPKRGNRIWEGSLNLTAFSIFSSIINYWRRRWLWRFASTCCFSSFLIHKLLAWKIHMWMETKRKKIRWFQAWIKRVDQGDWHTPFKISKFQNKRLMRI